MPTTLAASGRGAVPAENGPQPRTTFCALTLGSIGVVYGDIGTSPLYALREAVTAAVASATIGSSAQSGYSRKNGFSIAFGSARTSAPWPK